MIVSAIKLFIISLSYTVLYLVISDLFTVVHLVTKSFFYFLTNSFTV